MFLRIVRLSDLTIFIIVELIRPVPTLHGIMTLRCLNPDGIKMQGFIGCYKRAGFNMKLKDKDVLGIKELTAAEIELILDIAADMKKIC